MDPEVLLRRRAADRHGAAAVGVGKGEGLGAHASMPSGEREDGRWGVGGERRRRTSSRGTRALLLLLRESVGPKRETRQSTASGRDFRRRCGCPGDGGPGGMGRRRGGRWKRGGEQGFPPGRGFVRWLGQGSPSMLLLPGKKGCWCCRLDAAASLAKVSPSPAPPFRRPPPPPPARTKPAAAPRSSPGSPSRVDEKEAPRSCVLSRTPVARLTAHACPTFPPRETNAVDGRKRRPRSEPSFRARLQLDVSSALGLRDECRGRAPLARCCPVTQQASRPHPCARSRPDPWPRRPSPAQMSPPRRKSIQAACTGKRRRASAFGESVVVVDACDRDYSRLAHPGYRCHRPAVSPELTGRQDRMSSRPPATRPRRPASAKRLRRRRRQRRRVTTDEGGDQQRSLLHYWQCASSTERPAPAAVPSAHSAGPVCTTPSLARGPLDRSK